MFNCFVDRNNFLISQKCNKPIGDIGPTTYCTYFESGTCTAEHPRFRVKLKKKVGKESVFKWYISLSALLCSIICKHIPFYQCYVLYADEFDEMQFVFFSFGWIGC